MKHQFITKANPFTNLSLFPVKLILFNWIDCPTSYQGDEILRPDHVGKDLAYFIRRYKLGVGRIGERFGRNAGCKQLSLKSWQSNVSIKLTISSAGYKSIEMDYDIGPSKANGVHSNQSGLVMDSSCKGEESS